MCQTFQCYFGLVSNFSAARDLYENISGRCLNKALQEAPDEFKPIMVARIITHQSVPSDEETMNLFSDEHFDSNSPDRFVQAEIQNPVKVLQKLYDVYDVEKPLLVSAIQKLNKPRYSDKPWILRVLLAADAQSSSPRRSDLVM